MIEHQFRRTVVGTVAILFSAFSSAPGAVELKPEYPRLGGIQNGTTNYKGYGDPAYQAAMAKLDFVILGGGSRQMNRHAKAIKRMNPSIILGKYTNITTVRDKDSDYLAPLRKKLFEERGPNATNAVDWWLRDADGNRVEGLSGGNVRANITDWVKPDKNGDFWSEFRAKYDYEYWMKDDVWDVWYSDVGHWRPRFQGKGMIGDFSGGQEVSTGEIDEAWRKGHRRHWDAIRKLRPDILISVNHDWYTAHHRAGDAFSLGVYANQINGGMLEEVMAPDDGFEFNKGWDRLYEAYRWSYGYMVEPVVMMFTVRGQPEDYQFFRYAFTTCLLGGAFFDYLPDNKFRKGSVPWFDEFDRAGRDNTGWMGQPKAGSAFPASWKQGVYRRDFENAIVLVNPRGNGKRVVELEPGLMHLEGRQAPAVNHGGPAESVVLEDADGIVLVLKTYLDSVGD